MPSIAQWGADVAVASDPSRLLRAAAGRPEVSEVPLVDNGARDIGPSRRPSEGEARSPLQWVWLAAFNSASAAC